MNKPMRYLSDALAARALENAAFDRKHPDKPAPIVVAPKDARIGILMKKGKPMYYAYLGKRYIENRDLSVVEGELAK